MGHFFMSGLKEESCLKPEQRLDRERESEEDEREDGMCLDRANCPSLYNAKWTGDDVMLP